MSLNCVVIMFFQNYRANAIKNLIARMKRAWKYYVFSPYVKTSDLRCDGYDISVVSCFSEIDNSELKDHVVVVINDDGCIVIPEESALLHVQEHKCLGLIYMGDHNGEICYSSVRSRTPDQYFPTVFFHNSLFCFLIGDNPIINRWFSHYAILKCLLSDVCLVGFHNVSFFLPTLKCTSGLFISKTRLTSARVVSIINNELFFKLFGADFVKENHSIEKILAGVQANLSQGEKDYIDRHLSILTKKLYELIYFVDARKRNYHLDLKGKKTLIVKVESIGDVVVALPLIDAVSKSEASSVQLLTSTLMCPLFDDSKFYVSTLPVYLKDAIYTTSPYEDFDRYIELYGYFFENVDVVVFPRYFPDRGFFRYLAAIKGVKYRVGINNFVDQEGEYWNPRFERLLTHDLDVNPNQHEMDKISGLCELMNLSIPSDIAIIKNNGDDNIPFLAGKYVVVGIGASSNNRCWPINNYNLLVSMLSADIDDLTFVFIGGLDVFHNPVLESGRVVNLVGRLDIMQSFSVLKSAVAYIGNDSGAMHLAALAKTPVIEISVHPVSAHPYHVNSPLRFGPKNVKNIIFRPRSPAAMECFCGCVSQEAHCISNINVSDIYADVLGFIKSSVNNEVVA